MDVLQLCHNMVPNTRLNVTVNELRVELEH